MLKKLIIVYNPRSSHHADIEREVLAPARKLDDWLVGKYEVQDIGVEENAKRLAEILKDGNLVIAVGGDGTATLAANGVMLSGKDVALAVLGYGNFNDMARMLGAKRAVEYGGEYVGGISEIIERFEAGKTAELYPLEVKVDGKHWRYAPCYVTVGLFAESTTVFDGEKVRRKLQTGKKGLFFSLWQLVKWYFRNWKRDFLPEGELEQVQFGKKQGKENLPEKKVKIEKKALKKKAPKKVHSPVVEAKPKKQPKVANKVKAEKRSKIANKVVSGRTKLLELTKQTKCRLIELGGRSKAMLADMNVRTKVKVVEVRDKRQKKREQELLAQPEIIIDTRANKKVKGKVDEQE